MELADLFDSITPPIDASDGDLHFAALPVPTATEHRIAKDASSAPSFLLAVGDPESSAPLPVVRLQHLVVTHDRACTISRPDGSTERGRFTIVSCLGADRSLQRYFLDIVGIVVGALGPAPSRRDVTRAIDDLVELFVAMGQPPHATIQGLWAELFIISRSREPAAMIRAWHTNPDDLYDFNIGAQRLEAKSTASAVRHHRFSLQQLQPPHAVELLIASMFVRRAAGGLSTFDLATEARSRLGATPDLSVMLDRVIVATLGDSWREGLDARFDEQLARQSLAFFQHSDVPCLRESLPPGITDVEFTSDLTTVNPLSAGDMRNRGGLFASAAPR